MSALSTLRPRGAVPGGRVALLGSDLPMPPDGPPQVTVGGQAALVVSASRQSVSFIVPAETAGGPVPVRLAETPGEQLLLDVAQVLARDVHQVDSPLCLPDGSIYLTHSGTRGEKPKVPLYRVSLDGTREPISVEAGNPTSLALGPDGAIYVTSRFDGHIHRVTTDGHADLFATDLGVATGLACGPDGTLYVGDRTGTILRITPGGSGESGRHVAPFASLPASVAAFHLALGPDGCLYVTAPTLASHDVVYRITRDREVQVVCGGFGRPQGLAFDSAGVLFVADALAGASGLYRVDVRRPDPVPELVIAAPQLVGVAFHPAGGMVLASNDTVWRI